MRRSILAAALSCAAIVTGCGDGITAPVLSAPVGLALGAAAPVTTTLVRCSSAADDLSFDGVTWTKAIVVQSQGPYGSLIPGSVWIGPIAESGTKDAPEGLYHFRTSFTLPSDARNISLRGTVHADNRVTILLNGRQIYRQLFDIDYPNFQDPADVFTASSGIVAGANTVAFDLLNAGPGPSATALDYCFTVTYTYTPSTPGDTPTPPTVPTPEPPAGTCLSAVEVAKQYLKTQGHRQGSDKWNDVAERTERHTKRNGKFKGYHPCDRRFEDRVEKFVTQALKQKDRRHDDDDDDCDFSFWGWDRDRDRDRDGGRR